MLVATGVASASQLNVSISGFANPQTLFEETLQQSLKLRFTELVPAPGANASTHILIEGLSPLSVESSNYASTYSGVNVTTGEIQDSGVVYMEIPPSGQLPAGTVVSPIVGVVQRQGDWSSTNPSFPPTDISDSITGNTPAGPGNFDGTSMTLSLSNGSDHFSGTVNYAVIDTDTLLLDPFVLTGDGATSYSMSESVLIRNGNTFSGVLTNLEPTASYDSLIFTIDLDSIPDIDLDFIPDITDPIILVQNSWSNTGIGWVWTHSETVAYSLVLGWVSLADYPVIYHYELGWFQVLPAPVSMGEALWMHSPTLGWVYTQKDWQGDFFKNSAGWMLDNFLNPNP